ncbi:MAG: FtsH protease activity modulator HflK [Zoogloeaceae bacterium]|nr:FtsH protease activity modulator HflK [Zoogloeaceae bacterium]
MMSIPGLILAEGGNRPRRPDQGPPDLEDLWRDFTDRISDLFNEGKGTKRGRRASDVPPPEDDNGGPDEDNNGGGSHIPPRRPRKKTTSEFNPQAMKRGLFVLVAVAIVLWLSSGLYMVDASQRGVVLRFGKFVEITQPGLNWRLPAPFESHEIVNLTGVRTVEIGYRGTEKNKVLKEALMVTDDENIINIQFAVQYYLKSAEDYLFNDRQPDDAVMQAAETAVREIVGKNKMDFVLYEGREAVATQATKLMQEILDRYKTGIIVSKVTMQNAQPPEQVQDAFNDAVKASQDKERQKNEGQAYANDVIPRARGAAARLQAESEGYRQRLISTAEGDASRFTQLLSEYAKAPEVTRKRLYLETMQQVYSSVSKVMVDTKASGNLLYLPLNQLLQAGAASAPLAPHVAAEMTPGAGPTAAQLSGRTPPQVENAQNLNRELRSSFGNQNSSRGELTRDREYR